MIRFTALIVLILLLGVVGCQKRHPPASSTILRSLPERDFKVLDSFFQLVCREYDFAYTLFGKKPMSVAYYSSNLASFSVYHPVEFLTLEKGWEVWENYSALFPSEEFILKKCKEKNALAIFLINKREVLDIVLQNQIKFEEILNYKIEPHEPPLCSPARCDEIAEG